MMMMMVMIVADSDDDDDNDDSDEDSGQVCHRCYRYPWPDVLPLRLVAR